MFPTFEALVNGLGLRIVRHKKAIMRDFRNWCLLGSIFDPSLFQILVWKEVFRLVDKQKGQETSGMADDLILLSWSRELKLRVIKRPMSEAIWLNSLWPPWKKINVSNNEPLLVEDKSAKRESKPQFTMVIYHILYHDHSIGKIQSYEVNVPSRY